MNRMNESQIPQKWLPFIRALAVVLFLIAAGIAAALVPIRFEQLQEICYAETCPPMVLAASEIAALESVNLNPQTYALIQVGVELLNSSLYIAMAGLLIWRRSDTWMGVVAAVALAYFSIIGFMGTIETVQPNIRSLLVFTEMTTWLSMFLVLYIFPSGNFVPRWTRRIFFGTLIFFTGILPVAILVPYEQWGPIEIIFSVVILIPILTGVYAQIYRYRWVSDNLQRQQTKWIVAGFSVWAIVVATWMITQEIFTLPPGPSRLWLNIIGISLLSGLALLILPASMVIAILKYRLWDIDLIIRRTLIYGALTGTLALVYFVSVILLQRLLPAQTQLATILSTLAIAALFSPLRARIQRDIDRLFYRRKYNTEQTLAAFNATLREEVDLEHLSASLLTIVEDTMQPEGASLWLRTTTEDYLPGVRKKLPGPRTPDRQEKLLTTDSPVTPSVTIFRRPVGKMGTNNPNTYRTTVTEVFMNTTFTRIHKVLTTFISLAVFVQFFLAGLWHASVVSTPEAHAYFGALLLLAALLALIAALAGRMGSRAIRTTAVLFILILLQPILIEQRHAGIPFLSAFHTVNAAFIGMVSGVVARMPAAAKPPAAAELEVTDPVPAGD